MRYLNAIFKCCETGIIVWPQDKSSMTFSRPWMRGRKVWRKMKEERSIKKCSGTGTKTCPWKPTKGCIQVVHSGESWRCTCSWCWYSSCCTEACCSPLKVNVMMVGCGDSGIAMASLGRPSLVNCWVWMLILWTRFIVWEKGSILIIMYRQTLVIQQLCFFNKLVHNFLNEKCTSSQTK